MIKDTLKKLFMIVYRWFFYKRNKEIDNEIDIENINSFSTCTSVVCLCELLYLAISSFVTFGKANDIKQLLGVLGCVVFCIINSITIRIYISKTNDNSKANKLMTFISILYLLLSFFTGYMDIMYLTNNLFTFYFFLVQFCFILFISFRPILGFILITITYAAYLIGVIFFASLSNFNYIGFTIFYFLGIFGNAIKYSSRFKKYDDIRLSKIEKLEQEVVIKQSGKYIARYDLVEDAVYNGQTACDLLGLPSIVINPVDTIYLMDFIQEESRNDVYFFYKSMKDGIEKGSCDFKLKTLNGNIIYQHGDYTLLKDLSGTYIKSIISFSDVTKERERQLYYEQRLNEVVALSRDCDFYLEGSIDKYLVYNMHKITPITSSIPDASKKSINEIICSTWKDYIHIDDFQLLLDFFNRTRLTSLCANEISRDSIEFRLQSNVLSYFRIDLCILKSANGLENDFFALFSNISEAHKEYLELYNQATIDDLSGLQNRESTMRSIEEYLCSDGKFGNHALLMIDVDNLKVINDTLGHQIGDDALKKVGVCLKDTFRKNDICGRIGGDEFFAFLKNITSDKVIKKARKILDDLQLSYSNGNAHVETSVSIGISIYHSGDFKDLKQMYSEADVALYKSKKTGRNRFSFSEEVDAISTDDSTKALLKSEAISYSLRGLFDNLGNGIAIFHGSKDSEFVPQFCNNRLLELLGLTYDEFFTHMSINNLYANHPDDYDRIKEVQKEQMNSLEALRDTIQIKKKNGEYIHVTIFSNINKLADGSYDLYVIYSEATESDQLNHIRQLRYNKFISKYELAISNNTSFIHVNITENKVIENRLYHELLHSITSSSNVNELFKSFIKNIDSVVVKQEFEDAYKLSSFQQDYIDGNFVKEISLPLTLKEYGTVWFVLSTEILVNPKSKDLELFITFIDIDSDIRLGFVIDKLLDKDYEYIGQIDTKTKMLMQINNRNINTVSRKKIDFDEAMKAYLLQAIPNDYLEEALVLMNLDNILDELNNLDYFTCSFPTNHNELYEDRICEWRYTYTDSSKSSILIVRSNVSKSIDNEYSTLTGMLSRKGVIQKIREDISYKSNDYYLLEFDFDNFNYVNEILGYDEGNRFLRHFGADIRKLYNVYGKGTYFAHYEGDHFGILLPKNDFIKPSDVYQDLKKIVNSYDEVYRLPIRMGVYEINDYTIDPEFMCDCSHLALKSAKGRLESFITYYTTDLKDRLLDEKLLSSEMQNALDEEQFIVYFQPQVNHAAEGRLIGAEALVRWKHPERGIISPGRFIPLFEKSKMIYELDKYVWRLVCKTIRSWIDSDLVIVPISINISRLDILQSDFLDVITSIVNEYNIPLDLIHLEVTESAFTDNTKKVTDVVKNLINLGYTIAIDDFGSGYSSLSLLKNLPAHILKLDMRFFEEVSDSNRNECILESIVRMAKMLSMAVIAEGVEEKSVADTLLNAGVNYVQGYYYSKPLSYDDFMKYIAINNVYVPKEENDYSYNNSNNVDVSHSLFRNIITSSNDIIIVADINTKKVLYANRLAEDYYKTRFDPLVPMTCKKFCGNRHNCENCPSNRLTKNESIEYMFIDNEHHFKGHFSRMNWNSHDSFVFYQTDITEEMKQADFINSVIKNIPGALIVFTPVDNSSIEISYVSEKAIRLLSLAGINHKPTFEDCVNIVYKDDIAKVKKAFELSFSNNSSFYEVFRIEISDGRFIWLELALNPVKNKEGLYSYYGMYQDITDRKNSQDKADRLISDIPTALAIYSISNEDMQRVFISENAKKILNVTDDTYEKVSMDKVYSRIHPDDEQRVRTVTIECIKKKVPFSIQFKLKGSNDFYRYVQLDSTPIERDNSIWYYSIYTDISAEKLIEFDKTDKLNKITIHESFNKCLSNALNIRSKDDAINYILTYIGEAFKAERTYIFEQNKDKTFSNTYEWAKEGVKPEINNLQNVPYEICIPWVEVFRKQGVIIIDNVNSIKDYYPEIYELLSSQKINSCISAGFFDEEGEPIGFFGIDNPPKSMIKSSSAFVQTIAYFIKSIYK